MQLQLYKLPSANYHVYRQHQLELEKERKSQQVKSQQQPFYVPFIWQALVATLAGLVIICIGITLCILGYEAENKNVSQKLSPSKIKLTSVHHVNRTIGLSPSSPAEESKSTGASLPVECTNDCSQTSAVELSLDIRDEVHAEESKLKYLIYIGPVIMSCGSFAIVFSCVVVCETRDRVLQLLEKRRKQLEAMASGNRQEFLENLEENLLLSSTISLATNESNNNNRDNNDSFQSDDYQNPLQERRSSFQALHKLKIDVFTKSLIRNQLKNKLTSLVDQTKLETWSGWKHCLKKKVDNYDSCKNLLKPSFIIIDNKLPKNFKLFYYWRLGS